MNTEINELANELIELEQALIAAQINGASEDSLLAIQDQIDDVTEELEAAEERLENESR